MSGLLSHISVRRTTDVWRTPAGPNDDRMTPLSRKMLA